jgi:glycosyltransferase involved in cell wall biosynthesis
MRKAMPLVTVIIPTYNYGQYVSEAIDSVLASTFPQSEIEIIVIDDGSTDDTNGRVRAYGDRVQYIFQPNRGKAAVTKTGIDRSVGKYIFNLDADDLFLPEKIESVVHIFEADEEIVHVAHPALYWNADTGTKASETLPGWLVGRKVIGRDVLRDFYRKRILFGGGSTFAGRAEVLKTCPIPAEVDMYIDEYLVLATLNLGHSYFIERPLSLWRIHGGNYSGGMSEKAGRSMDSIKAVESMVLDGDFEPDIKMLYTLKTKVSELAMKEELGEKSCRDVLDLWRYLISSFAVFGKDSFEIMSRYTVLNRTLPTPILHLAKKSFNKSV